MNDRVILHMDMDYFFAQIEERENPTLKNQPIAVCIISEREGSMGAVATCNYMAREKGVKSGMACSAAKKACPGLIMVPARKEYYQSVSEEIMESIKPTADVFEQVSIDEAYIDATSKTDYLHLPDYISVLKSRIKHISGLTCSVGAGTNKLVAKIAASENKPDGQKIVYPGEVDVFLSKKPVSRLYGVGDKTYNILKLRNIDTVSDLRGVDITTLIGLFGRVKGTKLYWFSRGVDDSPVVERKKEQFSRLKSLRRESTDKKYVNAVISKLAVDVGKLLIADGRGFRTVTVLFILEDLTMKTKTKTLIHPTTNVEALSKTANDIASEFMTNNISVRRVGVSVSNLVDLGGQKSIFEF